MPPGGNARGADAQGQIPRGRYPGENARQPCSGVLERHVLDSRILLLGLSASLVTRLWQFGISLHVTYVFRIAELRSILHASRCGKHEEKHKQ